MKFAFSNHILLNKLPGNFQDPVELPGLAHFCEHMLFLGTEKYPEEGLYQKVINFDILVNYVAWDYLKINDIIP